MTKQKTLLVIFAVMALAGGITFATSADFSKGDNIATTAFLFVLFATLAYYGLGKNKGK